MLKAKKCHVSHINLSKASLEVWNLEAGQPKEIVVSIPIPGALPKLKGVNNSPECDNCTVTWKQCHVFP